MGRPKNIVKRKTFTTTIKVDLLNRINKLVK